MGLGRAARLAWVAVALVLGLVAGAFLLSGSDERPPGPSTLGLARFRNAGSEPVQATLEVKDAGGRLVQREQALVRPGSEVDVPVVLPEGAYVFSATFRTDALPPATAQGEARVQVGGCGAGHASGALFRVTGTRSSVALDGVDARCF